MNQEQFLIRLNGRQYPVEIFRDEEGQFIVAARKNGSIAVHIPQAMSRGEVLFRLKKDEATIAAACRRILHQDEMQEKEPPEPEHVGDIDLFDQSFRVEVHQGAEHTETEEDRYLVFTEDPCHLDRVFTLMKNDLEERLLAQFSRLQRKYLMQLEQPLEKMPKVVIDPQQEVPAITDLDRFVIILHPALVQVPLSYLEYLAADTLCLLMDQKDPIQHEKWMNELIPDWKDRMFQ